MNQHIKGTSLSDAVEILQQLTNVNASGNFKTATGSLRLKQGRVVKVVGDVLSGLVTGRDAAWGWRKVQGEPTAYMNETLTSLLLEEMAK